MNEPKPNAKQTADGTAWAERIYHERLERGPLPNLGDGYPPAHKAGYAVREIARRKLGGSATGRHGDGLWPSQRAFWAAVFAYGNARVAESVNAESARILVEIDF